MPMPTPQPRKRVNKFFLLLLACALPLGAEAQNGFRVNPGTGLEIEEARTPSRKKAQQAEAAERKPTEITASKETSFDEKTRVAVFVGDVTVTDSQFNLTCDRLTAQLRRPDAAAGKEGEAGGLEKVTAEGHVLIIQEKPDAEGKVTRYVGKANRAEYNAATGDVKLTGWPQIQQGINNQVATEEGTIMILNRSGNLKTIGGSKTVIQESSDPREKAGRAETNRRP